MSCLETPRLYFRYGEKTFIINSKTLYRGSNVGPRPFRTNLLKFTCTLDSTGIIRLTTDWVVRYSNPEMSLQDSFPLPYFSNPSSVICSVFFNVLVYRVHRDCG